MNKDYMGKVLLVDLDKGNVSVEEIPDSVYKLAVPSERRVFRHQRPAGLKYRGPRMRGNMLIA